MSNDFDLLKFTANMIKEADEPDMEIPLTVVGGADAPMEGVSPIPAPEVRIPSAAEVQAHMDQARGNAESATVPSDSPSPVGSPSPVDGPAPWEAGTGENFSFLGGLRRGGDVSRDDLADLAYLAQSPAYTAATQRTLREMVSDSPELLMDPQVREIAESAAGGHNLSSLMLAQGIRSANREIAARQEHGGWDVTPNISGDLPEKYVTGGENGDGTPEEEPQKATDSDKELPSVANAPQQGAAASGVGGAAGEPSAAAAPAITINAVGPGAVTPTQMPIVTPPTGGPAAPTAGPKLRPDPFGAPAAGPVDMLGVGPATTIPHVPGMDQLQAATSHLPRLDPSRIDPSGQYVQAGSAQEMGLPAGGEQLGSVGGKQPGSSVLQKENSVRRGVLEPLMSILQDEYGLEKSSSAEIAKVAFFQTVRDLGEWYDSAPAMHKVASRAVMLVQTDDPELAHTASKLAKSRFVGEVMAHNVINRALERAERK